MIIFLLKLLAKLPLRFWHRFGALLGSLTFWRNKRYAQRLQSNVFQSQLAQNPADFKRMVAQSAQEIGKGAAETIPIWFRPYDDVLSLVKQCSGWEYVEQARAQGKGILAMTPHLGCFEIVSLYYAARLPMTVMYRPPRQAWAEHIMRAGRQRGQVTLATADMKGVRLLLAALRRGEAVGILPDQVASKGEGAWADFFGRPAYTPTLPIRLHQTTGAIPLLMFGERLADGSGYHVHILPPDINLSGDKNHATRQLNAALEDLIRRYPTQYLWSYNRYKAPGGLVPPTSTEQHPDAPSC